MNSYRYSLPQSLWRGGVGFCFASLLVFATVAFGERWMYRHLGLSGAYAAWVILFILLGASALRPLVIGAGFRFYFLFGLAFLCYALAWVGAYFTLRGAMGEWVGSLAGSVFMGLVFALGFGSARAWPKLMALLFVTNSVGYFLGAALNAALGGKLGMLSWGAVYGFCLGVGLGAALYVAQAPIRGQQN